MGLPTTMGPWMTMGLPMMELPMMAERLTKAMPTPKARRMLTEGRITTTD